ncbi:MAG: ABC transporter permease [Pseudomonadota bacterium]
MTSLSSPDLPQQNARPQKPQRFRASRTIVALILREMSTRYGRSPGGYIWALVEPLAGIVVMAVAFSLVLRAPPIGTSFLLFYATGFLPYNLFQSLSVVIMRSMSFSRPLLRYPAVTWVDTIIARFILNTVTGLLVMYILMTGILMTLDTTAILDANKILTTLGLAAVLGLGIGALNCALMGLYPTWAIIWGIITRPLFLASGILYLYESLPQLAREVLYWNPLIHITSLGRSAFFPMYEPNYVSPLYVMIFASVSLFLGVTLLRRFHRHILQR